MYKVNKVHYPETRQPQKMEAFGTNCQKEGANLSLPVAGQAIDTTLAKQQHFHREQSHIHSMYIHGLPQAKMKLVHIVYLNLPVTKVK